MIIETGRVYADKKDFVKDIVEKFGAETRFFACSNSGMDADAAFDFLVQKGKIELNNQNNIGLAPDMSMCDGHEH